MTPMGRPCSICTHDQRGEIDRALASGTPFRIVAGRFGTSKSAAGRHRKDHLAPHLARALEEGHVTRAAELVREQEAKKARDIGQALDVVRQLQAINGACLEILQKSRASGKDTISLGAVDRIHRQIELQARLLGELQDGQTVNVLIAPEWHQVRLVVVNALRPYPDARAAVAQALSTLPAGGNGAR
jgi:uncharacterized membrane protein YccC